MSLEFYIGAQYAVKKHQHKYKKYKLKWKNTNKKTHSITNGISDKSPHVDFKNQFHKLILLTRLEPIVWILVGAHYAKKIQSRMKKYN